MCHQSVGLIQGQIEKAGIPTMSVTVVPYVTRNMLVPRAAYVRFPIGNPIGETGNADQQRLVLGAVLDTFEAIEEPGTTVELPFRWRRVASHIIDEDVEDLSEAYVIAKEGAAELTERYEALVEACERYRDRLTAVLEALDPETAQFKELVQIRRHISRVDDLLDLLEKPVHNQLLWNTTRYFLIQLAHEGKFR